MSSKAKRQRRQAAALAKGAGGRSVAAPDATGQEPGKEAVQGRWKMAGICAALVVMVFAVYGRTGGFEFVNYDDSFYVYENPDVVHGITTGGLVRAFTERTGGLWNPLVTISHMLDWQFFGGWAGGHHLTNVLIHAVSAALLFLVLRGMTGATWRSAFVAAVFAIHPLRVESVAWISERKDVLSGLFFMLTLGAYLRYARRPRSGRYMTLVAMFALGLMCKAMLVTTPFVLLLLDYWPLRRLFDRPAEGKVAINRRVIVEKIPLLALSLALSIGTMLAPKVTGFTEVTPVPFRTRMAEAPVWYVIYLGQMAWAHGLSIIYTHPEASLRWSAGAVVLLGAISAAAFAMRKRQPALWVGWLWNLGMLTPVCGIVQISRHARADHYNYLPQIGLYIGVAWLVADWAGERRGRRAVAGGVAAAFLCGLMAGAHHEAGFWRDNGALWTHAIEDARDNAVAHYNLGTALYKQGKTTPAVAQFREALRINPAYAEAHYNLGVALFQRGATDEAMEQYREALNIDPDYGDAHINLGVALFQQGKVGDAMAQYREALRIDPGNADAHYNLGNALIRHGEADKAAGEYREALRLNPASVEAHNNLGIVLRSEGKAGEAIEQYHEAMRLDPAFADAHYNLGNVLFEEGKKEEAAAEFQEALRLNPGYMGARLMLESIQSEAGQAPSQ